MRTPLIYFFSFIFSSTLLAQPNFTANDQVPTYDKQFLVGINPGWHGNGWNDQQLADISHGNPNVNVQGMGMQTFRVPIPDAFLEIWGQDFLVPNYQHYKAIGMRDLTVFLLQPSTAHRDYTEYCSGEPSEMWQNMYAPIWDNGANGTPVNDTNYAAVYIYNTVTLYKDNVRFWEILNEPDYGPTDTCGWRPQGWDCSWFDNTPDACATQIKAPVYYYIRLLKIAYEVIKTIDEDAFVGVGGIGFESYLDVLLRNTDNPVDGSVTPEYPLKGGAYFDLLSFHSYPHFNGTLVDWDFMSMGGGWTPRRHSDAAANGIVNHKGRMQAVLDNYGYDGTTYPKKEYILTETGLPNKSFNDWIGSFEAQKNYVMKVQVTAFQNNIRQIDFYDLANRTPYDQATGWLDVMGMHEMISDVTPYDVTKYPSAIGLTTMRQMLQDFQYDATQTAMMHLPDSIKGAAFDMGNGNYRYVLWAATKIDNSETANGEYTFPSDISEGGVVIREWDFSETGNVDSLFSSTLTLDGSPIFVDQFEYVDTTNTVSTQEVSHIEDVNILPNPFIENFTLAFFLRKKSDVQIELRSTDGKLVNTLLQKDLIQGQHQIQMSLPDIPTGMYFGKINTDTGAVSYFKIMKK